jgi:hypothetical protein
MTEARMYEHRRDAMLPFPAFVQRVIGHAAAALGILAFGVIVGMAGFRWSEHYSWLDAFLNTCMLLGGMGQVSPIVTSGGKIFAGCFALFAGLVFIGVSTLLVAPFAHRVIHRLHLER